MLVQFVAITYCQRWSLTQRRRGAECVERTRIWVRRRKGGSGVRSVTLPKYAVDGMHGGMV